MRGHTTPIKKYVNCIIRAVLRRKQDFRRNRGEFANPSRAASERPGPRRDLRLHFPSDRAWGCGADVAVVRSRPARGSTALKSRAGARLWRADWRRARRNTAARRKIDGQCP